nr:MAG TPA: hypothetical protein [Caudoviricetes sp.]
MTLEQMRTRKTEIENRLSFLWDAKEMNSKIRFGEFNALLREKEKLAGQIVLSETRPFVAKSLGILT